MQFSGDKGKLLYKTSCGKCGSSDANAIYSSGTAYCWSCSTWSVVDESVRPIHSVKKVRGMLDGEFKTLKARGIPEEI